MDTEGGIFEATLRPSDRASDRASDRPIDRAIERSSDRAIEGAIERPSDRTNERPSDRVTERPSDRTIERPSVRANMNIVSLTFDNLWPFTATTITTDCEIISCSTYSGVHGNKYIQQIICLPRVEFLRRHSVHPIERWNDRANDCYVLLHLLTKM